LKRLFRLRLADRQLQAYAGKARHGTPISKTIAAAEFAPGRTLCEL
jgi:hypothetical protein